MTEIQTSKSKRPVSRIPVLDRSLQVGANKDSVHLSTLCEIMAETSQNFEEQVQRALLEGLAMLQLELGIVSNISGNNYTILFFSPDSASLERNQVFDLKTTYCALTVENQDVVDIDDMSDSPYSGHPCYTTFGLESYIGVPILVEGEPFGTLNFSSTVRRAEPFTESDKNFVRLMGRWIGSGLASRIREKELQSYRTELEDLVAERTNALRKTNEHLRQEITENELARRTLLKERSFLNTLIETIPIPVFYKDISGRYLGCNHAFEEFSSRSRSEIIGKTVFETAPKYIAEIYYEKDRELFENPGTQQYEWKFKKSDGEESAVVFEKATFTDEGGEVAGMVGSLFDITERKKIDKQLIQAQKLQAIGTLSNGIAHDFNNILSAMMGYTELARMKLSDHSQIRADLDKVYTAGKRAVDLVKQILTFSRQGNQDIQPVKVGPLVREVLKLMRATLPAMIEIRNTTQAGVMVMADPSQLHQVLMNLCTNAGYTMMEAGGVLEVTLESTTNVPHSIYPGAGLATGPFMKLQVKDTGTGIPPDIIDRIFDPFFSTKDPGKGTGLGLSVVHGIIKDLDGIINVTSEMGAGSVFEILIPMVTEIREEAVPASENTLPRGNENILYVDDEELLAELGKKLLEKLGYSVTPCTSGSEALTIFKNDPKKFDLVITDETMPKITGTMLAAELNQISPETPLILCSGFASSYDLNNETTKGIKAFILKPIVPKTISLTVREVLDGIVSNA